MGSAPSVLSMVRTTSARPRGGRLPVPAKMTSSILPPRNDFAPCSPMTQASASTTLDLPEPLGPTTQVMPGSNRSVVDDAKDLKPRSVRFLRYTRALSLSLAFWGSSSLGVSPRTVERYRSLIRRCGIHARSLPIRQDQPCCAADSPGHVP